MSQTVTELRGQLEAIRKEIKQFFDEAGPDMDMSKVKCVDGDSQAKTEWLRAKNLESADLGERLEKANENQREVEEIKKRNDALGELQPHPGHNGATKQEAREEGKSFGELFTESIAFKSKGTTSELKYDLKATFERATGWVPDPFLSPRFVDALAARRPLMVADLIPSTTTTSSAIRYFLETAFTNVAVEVAEGTAKPEATLAVGTRTDNVEKIAVWIPVTDEQLADVPMVRQYLENRLGYMVRQRLDSQILVGNGTAPNLSGITDRAGIQTQAKGADPTPDAVYKAMTKIRVNDFSEPNAVVFHPNDWQAIRLLTTADGIYLWGPPMDAGPERIWGLRVVQTVAMTENTALVGDFNQAMLAMREGLTVKITDSHASLFISNIQVILVELRAALAVFREAAFCTVTGI